MSFLGPEGINARISQIQSRLDALGPRETAAAQQTASPQTATAFRDHLDACGGNAPLEPVLGGDNPVAGQIGGKSELRTMALNAAQTHGVDPELFGHLVEAESGWNPSATSPVGAKGLCQLMDPTARALGVTDSYDPAQSLNGGAKYLRQMLDQFDGDPSKALAAYNAGPNFVKHHGPGSWPHETVGYVKRILGNMRGNGV